MASTMAGALIEVAILLFMGAIMALATVDATTVLGAAIYGLLAAASFVLVGVRLRDVVDAWKRRGAG